MYQSVGYVYVMAENENFWLCTNPLMRITMSFGMKKVFKDQERGWYDDIKKSEKPKLGMSPWYILAYLKKTQASKLGDAQGIPFFINKVSGLL